MLGLIKLHIIISDFYIVGIPGAENNFVRLGLGEELLDELEPQAGRTACCDEGFCNIGHDSDVLLIFLEFEWVSNDEN